MLQKYRLIIVFIPLLSAYFAHTSNASNTLVRITEDLPIVTWTKADVLCFGDSTGSIDLTVTGGTGLTYIWSTADGSGLVVADEDQGGLSAGTYNVTISDDNNWTTSESITINEPADLTCSAIQISPVSINGGNDGRATVTPTGGIGPYIYEWDNTESTTTALNFDDVDNYVDCGNAFSLTSYTKEAWINFDGPNDQNNIISGRTSNSHAFWAPTGKIRAGHVSPFDKVEDFTPLPFNEWIHYAVSYDGSNGTWVLYRNGIEIKRLVDPSTAGFVLTDVYLGAFNNTSSGAKNLFKGKLDDLRLWSTVRTPAEIAANYDQCLSGSETGLVALYKFEDGTADNSASTGSVHDGTLVGVTVTDWVSGQACGDTQQTATALTAGLHSVTVTDANGCITSCDVTIGQPGSLTCNIVQDSAVECFGEANGQATVTPIGGVAPFTYLWDNAETTQTAVALTAGSHSVVVTDANSTATMCNITITEPEEILADAPIAVEACDTYELPVLTNGNYFTATGGTGTALSAGDDITTTTTLFVYSAGTESCADVENSFTVTINDTPQADAPIAVEACDKYTLPSLTNGNYFTATGGTGTALSAGDDITTTTTLFVYSAGTGSCADVENSFTVTINDTPLADAPIAVEACDTYELPVLTNGNYFTATGGTGDPLSAGDDITTTTTLFVYSAGTGSCADVENSFIVTINDTPLADAPIAVEACDTYELPVLTNGNYFTATGGTGTALSAGDDITTTTTVFVYSAGTGSCADVENSFTVTINDTPQADAPIAVEACDTYELPVLTNGNYFTATGGTGTALSAGDDITTTTTLFVYSAGTGSCADVENSFIVTINDTPLADAPIAVEACDTYELPVLTNGNYFTATGGTGTALSAGDDITTTTTLFVYSAGTGSCADVENSFTVMINDTPLADAPIAVEACDTYELPVLTNGNYFTATGGTGDPLSAGDDITTTTTLFVYSAGTESCADVENSFTVTINDTPLADAPSAVEACDTYELPVLTNGNYFTATGGTGTALSAGDDITTTTTVFVYSAGTGSCADVENSFTVMINDTPLADAPIAVEACDTYELPVLTNGNYFTATGGTGDPLSAGDDITTTTTVFVYSAGTGSCADVENSFTVTINDTPLADAPIAVEACDKYTLPSLTNGNYFTATGGTGTALSAGDDITTTTTVFVYSAGTGSCADVENSFTVTINDTPQADAPIAVEACDTYELPVLTNGNYFTATGGTGTPLSAGDDITTTTTLFVYSAGTGSCADVENSFTVTINDTPQADAPIAVEACDTYELPVLTNGNYFTATGGTGDPLSAGDDITTTTTVFVYSAGTGSCADVENSFTVTINDTPQADAPIAVEACDTYELPVLTNGNYFTATGGTGTALSAGDDITTTTTLFVYSAGTGSCADVENSFTVTINDTPQADAPIAVEACDTYELPVLTNGNYFTATGGTGDPLSAGDDITTTTTVFVYSAGTGSCADVENSFTVMINDTPLADAPIAVEACDTYELPVLTNGNYFTATGGTGTALSAGDDITTTTTLFVYSAGTGSCADVENSFTVTINDTPQADAPIAVEACDTYELPVLTNGNYFTATGGTGTALSAGDDITTTTTLFVYSAGTGSCADVENSFTVMINDTPLADAPIAVEACDTYELPVLTNGNYFTATGGTGTALSAGDDITTTTTLFVYSAGTGSCADVENSFTVMINDTPLADAPIAVEACDTYELPVLTNGNYFTATGGTGDPLSAGDDITTTTTLFVYSAGTESCADVENSFTVTINDTPLADAPSAVEACDTYELPVLTNGNYFTATGGTGTALSAGDDITTTTTVFVYSAGTGSCADVENSFTVMINDTPLADAPIAVEACDTYELPVLTNGNYFTATGGTGDPLSAGDDITTTTTVFVYSAGTGSCADVENSFTVTINDTPQADAPIAVEACDTYELPVLTNGNYFTATGGTGTALSAGDDITTTTTVFVYSAGTGSCADVENSFTVTINDTPQADAPIAVEACDTYELPVLTNGNYFTATGGTGTPLSAGDDITTTTTLFVYSAGTGSCADVENSFTVTINDTPQADAPIAVEACDTYELPVLTNGNYFTATGGTGDPLSAGDDITTTTTVFVYSAGTGSCADVENSFTVMINDTPLADAPIAVEACDTYELPVLTNGNYFTATGGTGTALSAGDDITTTTTLFVYSAGTGSCADVENSFTVTINDTPQADAPIAVEACDTYELPVLTNGNYFTATGGTGDPLSAGDDITTTTTLFVYSAGTGSCADVENSFTVMINDTPLADAPIAVEACDTYELPVLTNGNYFTATGGTGDPLSAGDDITTTTTLFVYSAGTGSCADVENSFIVTINDTPLADAPIAVEACDTYELPVLTNGNYFTATGGTGDPLSAGDDITTTTTVFVYSAGTGSCADVENSFTVTINDTPQADAPIAVEACDKYTLPSLTNGNYFTATGGTGTALSAGDDITTTTTVFVYSAGTGSCADVENSFTVTINDTPQADAPIAVEACDTYELPVLTNGNYFTATGGTGTPLSAGDDITTTTTLFVYSAGTGSCADVENSFTVTINDTPQADAPIAVEACDTYELPVLTNGNYFTATGGTGDPLSAGDDITTTTTVFVYSAGTGSCADVENSFTVMINDTPLADAPIAVEACDTYELPVLTNGNYFTATGGTGDPLSAGDDITTTTTVFVYSAGMGSCADVENSFIVTINDTPLADAPSAVEACDTYELPVLTNGNYFTATGGTGTALSAGDDITTTMTVFVYSAGTGSCADVENSFTVTINDTPQADAPIAVEACDTYELPVLTNGNYFTATGGTGDPLSAGDDITTTTTVFVYSAGTGSCADVENSFTVMINDTPLADAPIAVEACDTYELPVLTNGNYFTATGGTGTALSAGDDITTTTTVFVYSAGTGSCADVENSFTVTINPIMATGASVDIENYGESTGSIDITLNGGTAPFTFAWTGPDSFTASSEDLTDLAAGTYDLMITDVNACIFNYNVTISQPDAFISINTKVLLGGPYNSSIGLMNDDLRNNGVIPIFSPYADVLLVDSNVFNSGGLNGTGLAEDDIVDWIWIELRDPNDNTNIIVGQSALLQRDGDVVDLDGTSVLSIGVTPGDYYVGVRHRNHLGVLSMTTVELTHSPALIVDFTNSGFSTFGANAQALQVSGKMALWAGNVNSDTTIQYVGAGPLDTSNLLAFILNDTSNFLNLPSWPVSGYDIHDVDMNGMVQFTGAGNLDTQCILQNILSYPGNFLNLSTWQILEQLPEN